MPGNIHDKGVLIAMGAATTGSGSKPASAFKAGMEVVALAFQLPEAEIAQLPEQVLETLTSEEVRKAIGKSLEEFALTKMGKAGTAQLSDEDVNALIETLGKAGSKAAGDVLTGKIKDTPEFKALECSFNEFKVALGLSPLGVWVDNEKGYVVVIGLVLAVGGTIALFYTRAGGPFVEFPINQIKGKKIELWSPGSFVLSGKLLEFQPSTRRLGIEVIGEQTWDRLNMTLQLSIAASEKGVSKAEGKVAAVIDNLTVKAEGSVNPLSNSTKLGVVFEIGKDGLFDLSAHAIIKDGKVISKDLTGTYKVRPGIEFSIQGEEKPQERRLFLMTRLRLP